MNCPHCEHELSEADLRAILASHAGAKVKNRPKTPAKKVKCRYCTVMRGRAQIKAHEATCPNRTERAAAVPLDSQRSTQALMLRAKGLSYREIGEKLDMKTNSVFRLLQRYAQKLRDDSEAGRKLDEKQETACK